MRHEIRFRKFLTFFSGCAQQPQSLSAIGRPVPRVRRRVGKANIDSSETKILIYFFDVLFFMAWALLNSRAPQRMIVQVTSIIRRFHTLFFNFIKLLLTVLSYPTPVMMEKFRARRLSNHTRCICAHRHSATILHCLCICDSMCKLKVATRFA